MAARVSVPRCDRGEGAAHAVVPRGDLALASRWLAATYWRSARTGEVEDVLLALVGAFERTQGHGEGHALRVGAVSRWIAERMGLGPDEVAMIGRAGRLHDVGKVATDRAGATGLDESPPTGRHAAVGAQLVVPFGLLAAAAPMIRHHHERVDGGGQPDGLRGAAIPLGARIIAVADAYDHLTEGSGPAGLSQRAALVQLMREAGRTLDATVICALRELALP
jgi:HD-GYP domain-containing protein (c-di-GMP phosphodiesterase class II)